MEQKTADIVREGKRTQVRELFNSSISNVFKGSLPATIIEQFVKSVDDIYYGEK